MRNHESHPYFSVKHGGRRHQVKGGYYFFFLIREEGNQCPLRTPVKPHWPELVLWHPSLKGSPEEQVSDKAERIVQIDLIMIHFLELVLSLAKQTWNLVSQEETIAFEQQSNSICHA